MDSFSNNRPFIAPIPPRVETPEGAASNSPPPPQSEPFVPRQTSYSSSTRSPTVDYRNRERDTHPHRSHAPAPARVNEYFIPKDGIDKEVIAADICRYLGNDALVRSGNYTDPATGVVKQGYFINAYRNLTSAMIADLKADTERWSAERMAARGRAPYGDSTTHQSRQYYGPTDGSGNPPSGNPSHAPGYSNSSSTYQNPSSNYGNPVPYESSTSAGYPPLASNNPGYGSNPNSGGYTYNRPAQDYPYAPPQPPPGGGNIANPTSPTEYGARGEYQPSYGAASAAANSSAYYSSQSNTSYSPSQYQPPQGPDPYYNRPPNTSGHDDNQNSDYDTGYQAPQEYAPLRTTPVANTSHQTTRRRERDSGHYDQERRERHPHPSRR